MASRAAVRSTNGTIITHANKQPIFLWPSQTFSNRQCCSCLCSIRSSAVGASDVTAIPEDILTHDGQQKVIDPPASGARQQPAASASTTAATASSNPKEPLYKALLAIILKLAEQSPQQQQQQAEHLQQQLQIAPQQQQQQQQQDRLEAFLRSQPLATSVPFISWLADLEASAAGAQKVQLAWLCEVLMVLREVQDEESQEQLYSDTIRLLSGGNQQVAALMSAEPRQYALALAEGVTCQPLALQGYGMAYDMLLQVAPAAALTPTAVAEGHQLAAELARDLSSRRKSTLAAMLGRTKVSSEQQAQLMGGSPASRICDLLLTLSSQEERFALLPDCFTPPPAAAVAAAAEDPSSGIGQENVETLIAGSTAGQPLSDPAAAVAQAEAAATAETADQEAEMEELWCTPIQLLNEINRRLKTAAVAAAAAPAAAAALPSYANSPTNSHNHHSSSSTSSLLLTAGEKEHAQHEQQQEQQHHSALTGEAAVTALQELQQHIESSWLQSVFAPSEAPLSSCDEATSAGWK